jgi:putative transposase
VIRTTRPISSALPTAYVGAAFRRPIGTRLAQPTRVSQYPEHQRTIDYRGPHRYFLTFCTHERRPHFADGLTVDLTRTQFLRAATEERCSVIAYCFMPDHVHLLIEGEREDVDLKRFIKSAKQYSGFYFTRQRRERLWQRYGFERVLRNEEATPDVVRYTIANPVRAGLVAVPMDYPFWGSFRYTREELLEYIQWAA